MPSPTPTASPTAYHAYRDSKQYEEAPSDSRNNNNTTLWQTTRRSTLLDTASMNGHDRSTDEKDSSGREHKAPHFPDQHPPLAPSLPALATRTQAYRALTQVDEASRSSLMEFDLEWDEIAGATYHLHPTIPNHTKNTNTKTNTTTTDDDSSSNQKTRQPCPSSQQSSCAALSTLSLHSQSPLSPLSPSPSLFPLPPSSLSVNDPGLLQNLASFSSSTSSSPASSPIISPLSSISHSSSISSIPASFSSSALSSSSSYSSIHSSSHHHSRSEEFLDCVPTQSPSPFQFPLPLRQPRPQSQSNPRLPRSSLSASPPSHPKNTEIDSFPPLSSSTISSSSSCIAPFPVSPPPSKTNTASAPCRFSLFPTVVPLPSQRAILAKCTSKKTIDAYPYNKIHPDPRNPERASHVRSTSVSLDTESSSSSSLPFVKQHQRHSSFPLQKPLTINTHFNAPASNDLVTITHNLVSENPHLSSHTNRGAPFLQESLSPAESFPHPPQHSLPQCDSPKSFHAPSLFPSPPSPPHPSFPRTIANSPLSPPIHRSSLSPVPEEPEEFILEQTAETIGTPETIIATFPTAQTEETALCGSLSDPVDLPSPSATLLSSSSSSRRSVRSPSPLRIPSRPSHVSVFTGADVDSSCTNTVASSVPASPTLEDDWPLELPYNPSSAYGDSEVLSLTSFSPSSDIPFEFSRIGDGDDFSPLTLRFDMSSPHKGAASSALEPQTPSKRAPDHLQFPNSSFASATKYPSSHNDQLVTPTTSATTPNFYSPSRSDSAGLDDSNEFDFDYDYGYEVDSDDTSVYSHNLPSDPATNAILAGTPSTKKNIFKPELTITTSRATEDELEEEEGGPKGNSARLSKSPVLAKIGTFFSWSSPSSSSTPLPLADDALSATGSTNSLTPHPRSASNASLSDPPLSPRSTTSIIIPDLPPQNLSPPLALSYESSLLNDEFVEMEDEIKAIGAELAASIRREMDLEDIVDKLQGQTSGSGKRSSDYYSDSGYSSKASSESEPTRDDIRRIQRKSEQEKAQLRLDLTAKLQEERTKRRDLDEKVQELSQKVSAFDSARLSAPTDGVRLQELEKTCEDLKRQISEERDAKSNLEELCRKMKSELATTVNERDNLRDEVVPSLRAQVDGLEAQASEYDNLTYESSKLQREVSILREENESLKRSSTARSPLDSPKLSGLTRSNSVASRSPGAGSPISPLSRSNTVKQHGETKEMLAERLRDVEAQRDALHTALKSLLDRQEFLNRENRKKIRALEMERDRLIKMSPHTSNYEREIVNLKHEVATLRRRAEDAIDQKWRVEDGLRGLKMDLDRAEGEVASLRGLLEDKKTEVNADTEKSKSESEEIAASYAKLRVTYEQALARIKELEEDNTSATMQAAISRLESSLAAVTLERDAARTESDNMKKELASLYSQKERSSEEEVTLTKKLTESATRVEELSSRVRDQLRTNEDLRQRLTEAVKRGELDHKKQADHVATLQAQLRTMEDKLNAAQNRSEERLAKYEEEINRLRDAQNAQLRRMDPTSAGAAAFTVGNAQHRRTLLSTQASTMFARNTLHNRTLAEATEIQNLHDRVAGMEKALAEADHEMQKVVSRMSAAQMEVITLHEQRDQAIRETKRLHDIIESERAALTPDSTTSSNSGILGYFTK